MSRDTHKPRKPRTATLIDLAIQLHRDEAEPIEKLRRRDRAIGRRLAERGALEPRVTGDPHGGADRVGLLTAWLAELDAPVHRGGEALTFVGFATVLLGAVLGYGVVMGLLVYDGTTPVNVVGVVAVFVVGQAFTLILFGLAATPGRIPGAGALRGLSPGRWATWVARWLPRETREALGSITGRAGRHERVYGRVQKWQVLTWSQAMAVAFHTAALVGALQLIVFSDLGFGWSTTLDVEAAEVHGLTEALAVPWAWAWPAASPPPELVEATQTFRALELREQVEPQEAARWWPFVVMCIAGYGVLPRLVTLGWSRWRLSAAVGQAVRWTPGADAVVDRLTARAVETRGAEHESVVEAKSETVNVEPSEPIPGGAMVRWADAPVEVWSGVAVVSDAGGGRSLDDDRRAIEAVRQSEGTVSVVVKGWEPPVLELLDFLRDLRAALGGGRAITVTPIGDGDLDVWRQQLGTLGDPWLTLTPPEAPPEVPDA
ncbi:MAG: DUF2868 domain-containing protein [Planctomycetota bacterium]